MKSGFERFTETHCLCNVKERTKEETQNWAMFVPGPKAGITGCWTMTMGPAADLQGFLTDTHNLNTPFNEEY